MKLSYKTFWLLFSTAILVVLAVGCNDTLRQFITPVPQPNGDPGRLAHSITLSTNPAGDGSDTHIDVSGDTEVGVVTTGPNPIFLGKTANRAFVINGDGTVTVSLALLPNSGTNTVTLPTAPPNAATGSIGGGTSSTGNIYIANQTSDNVSVISGNVLAVTATVALLSGSHPVMIAGNPSNNKIYVVNNGTNSVTVVSTIDNTVVKTITVGSSPVWAVMSADALDVFVVNQGDGTVSVIDTLLDLNIATIQVGMNPGTSSPNFAFYDANLKRVYVSNTGENTITAIKANGIDLGVSPPVLPVKLKDIPVSGAPTSVAALSDASKVYAALGGCPAGTNHINMSTQLASCNGSLVSVIDANALVETKTIQVAPGAVALDVASDASRVYVVSAHDITTIKDNVHNPSCTAAPCGTTGGGCIALPCLPGPSQPDRTFSTPSVSIIRTSTDSVLRPPADPSVTSLVPTVHVPQQDPNCVATVDSNFNKTPLPCVGQTPFTILTAP